MRDENKVLYVLIIPATTFLSHRPQLFKYLFISLRCQNNNKTSEMEDQVLPSNQKYFQISFCPYAILIYLA